MRNTARAVIDRLGSIFSRLLAAAKAIRFPRNKAPKAENGFSAPGLSDPGAVNRLEALKPILKSKPFIAVASAASFLVLVSLIVSLLLARPLPKGRERLPELKSLSSLDGFTLPDFPERFELVEYARDPEALPERAELESFVFGPKAGAAEDARRLAREAAEEYYESVP